MFYYRDINNILIASLKEIASEKLIPLTKEEYDALQEAAATIEE